MRSLRCFAILSSLFLAGPASACGNPLLWAMLFARVPEAEAVFEADLAAREEGTLQARVFVPVNLDEGNDPLSGFSVSSLGLSFHQWSMKWLSHAADALNASIVDDLAQGETFTILLADAVASLHFAHGEDPRVVSAAGLDFAKGFDAITTVNALESGLNHGLSAQQMTDDGVFVFVNTDTHHLVAELF